jgi:ADP-ribose pyrophosphatase YjhB (NUDIX family)
MSHITHAAISFPEVQLAAGGLVWKKVNGDLKLAVIHRPKYDDWSLPKGKPERRESLSETAWREVKEELGCEARFLDFAGVRHYPLADGRLKVVLFWNMVPTEELRFQPNTEVDQMLWLSREEAARKLSHQTERELVARSALPSLT